MNAQARKPQPFDEAAAKREMLDVVRALSQQRTRLRSLERRLSKLPGCRDVDEERLTLASELAGACRFVVDEDLTPVHQAGPGSPGASRVLTPCVAAPDEAWPLPRDLCVRGWREYWRSWRLGSRPNARTPAPGRRRLQPLAGQAGGKAHA